MASSTASKWLIGCGVGCLFVGLVVVAIATGGVMFFRDTLKGFDAAVEARADLEQRFGKQWEFTPWPNGEIPADRIERFIGVRDGTAEARRQIADKFAAIPMSESEAQELDSKPTGEKALSIFKIVGSALGLGAELGDFFEARNNSLLEREMGMGEYTYLYVVTYYSWLGHSAGDGPQTGRDQDGSIDVEIEHVQSERRMHDDLVSMLRNQLEQDSTSTTDEWVALLTTEIDAMERDSRRSPWQEGLPPAMLESLEPYRDRLVDSYDPISNAFELVINKKDGWSITAD